MKVGTVLGVGIWIGGLVIGSLAWCAHGTVAGLVAVAIAIAAAGFVVCTKVGDSMSGSSTNSQSFAGALAFNLALTGLFYMLAAAVVGWIGSGNLAEILSIALALLGAALVAFGIRRTKAS